MLLERHVGLGEEAVETYLVELVQRGLDSPLHARIDLHILYFARQLDRRSECLDRILGRFAQSALRKRVDLPR